jgi:hypothetical protein
MDKTEKREMVVFLHRVMRKLNGNHPENGIDELASLCNQFQSEIRDTPEANGTDVVYTCTSCSRQIKGDVFHDKDGKDVCLPCYREENAWLKKELAKAKDKLSKIELDQQNWRNTEG